MKITEMQLICVLVCIHVQCTSVMHALHACIEWSLEHHVMMLSKVLNSDHKIPSLMWYIDFPKRYPYYLWTKTQFFRNIFILFFQTKSWQLIIYQRDAWLIILSHDLVLLNIYSHPSMAAKLMPSTAIHPVIDSSRTHQDPVNMFYKFLPGGSSCDLVRVSL
jgi:hypothetical protein